MASSLLVLLDDIATVLDDVSVLTKAAAKKTAGVLGDDLAVNAEQVSGVSAARELPVVWAVFKGSLLNKAILVPGALAIGAFAPWAITPLLMLGGAYLCFEAFEKILHARAHGDEAEAEARVAAALSRAGDDPLVVEREQIRGAIRTDFILSAEIIAITLGVVADAEFRTQVGVLSGLAVLITIGVYGLVAAIVKIDDLGLYLVQRPGTSLLAHGRRHLGHAILRAAPHLMRGLSIVGTAAMFLVGGGIISHGVPPLEAAIHRLAEAPGAGEVLGLLAPVLAHGVVGIAVGAVVVALVAAARRVLGASSGAA